MATFDFTHMVPGQQVEAIAGYYEMDREMRLEIDGREVLCIVGNALWDKSCCGMGGCRYALVPGYVLEYRTRTNDEGESVSKVEPITDKIHQMEIKRRITEAEYVQQVNFW